MRMHGVAPPWRSRSRGSTELDTLCRRRLTAACNVKVHPLSPCDSWSGVVQERMDGVASARRGRSMEETLAVWVEMQAGSEEGLRNCLRLKMDMSAANKALRDPVAFRCNPTPHHRTGTRFRARTAARHRTPWICSCWQRSTAH